MENQDRSIALHEQEFERLFVDELGWDRFTNRISISFLAPGQLSRGWQTREERMRRSGLRQLTFALHGVARLGGQVVFMIYFPDERSMPDYLGRCAIGGRAARLHYEPIVIYSCPSDREQVWQFVSSVHGVTDFFEHRVDSRYKADRFSKVLQGIAFSLAEREAGLSGMEANSRVRRALSYPKQKRTFDRSRQTAATFEEFGNGLPELAEVAEEHRGLERDEEAALVSLARTGSSWAKLKLFKSHLFLPLKLGERAYRQKNLHGRVELPDLVSYGIIGLLNAVRLYTPEKSPRFMTFASLWVQRTIDRDGLTDQRTIAIPFYLETDLASQAKQFDIEADRLAQRLFREPYSIELQRHLGLDDKDWLTLDLMLDDPEVINIEAPDVDCFAESHSYVEWPFEPPSYSEDSELLTGLLSRLTPRNKDVLLLRYGLHPDYFDEEHTLEEVAGKLGVTRERVRQIELKAKRSLIAMVVALKESNLNSAELKITQ